MVLVENEGNIRLTSSAPKIHIAVAGIEKMIPRAQDLAVFLKLLGRSGTGQALTVYTSFLSGPRRPGEIDGPDEFYVLLLDNGRTKLLADREKRQSLYCIRCGACLNVCPVYRKIGGHSFPVGLFRADRRHYHAAIPGRHPRTGAAVRLEPVRRLRRSLPGQNQHSQGAARFARGRKEGRSARGCQPHGAAGIPGMGMGDAASAHLRNGGNGGCCHGACDPGRRKLRLDAGGARGRPNSRRFADG